MSCGALGLHIIHICTLTHIQLLFSLGALLTYVPTKTPEIGRGSSPENQMSESFKSWLIRPLRNPKRGPLSRILRSHFKNQKCHQIQNFVLLSCMSWLFCGGLVLSTFDSLIERGAGIGGLSLSAGLGHMSKDRKLNINIYEAASHISEIGAGINVWPRTWSIYKALGLEDVLLPLLPEAPDDSMSEQQNNLSVIIILISTKGFTSKSGRVTNEKASIYKILKCKVRIPIISSPPRG